MSFRCVRFLQVIRLLAALAESPHATRVFFSPCSSEGPLSFPLPRAAPTQCVSPLFLSLVFSLLLPYCQIAPSEEHALLHSQTVLASFAEYPYPHSCAKESRRARAVVAFLVPDGLPTPTAPGRFLSTPCPSPCRCFARGHGRGFVQCNELERAPRSANDAVHGVGVASCGRTTTERETSDQQHTFGYLRGPPPAACQETDRVDACEQGRSSAIFRLPAVDKKGNAVQRHAASRREEVFRSSPVSSPGSPRSSSRTGARVSLPCAACRRLIRSSQCFAFRPVRGLSCRHRSSPRRYSGCATVEDCTAYEASSETDGMDEFLMGKASERGQQESAVVTDTDQPSGRASSGSATLMTRSSPSEFALSSRLGFSPWACGGRSGADELHLHTGREMHPRHPSPSDACLLEARDRSSSEDHADARRSHAGSPGSKKGREGSVSSYVCTEVRPSTLKSAWGACLPRRHALGEGSSCFCTSVLTSEEKESPVACGHCRWKFPDRAADADSAVTEQEMARRCQMGRAEDDEEEQTEEDSIRMAALHFLRTLQSRGGRATAFDRWGCRQCEGYSMCVRRAKGDGRWRRTVERGGTEKRSARRTVARSIHSTSCESSCLSVPWSSASEGNSDDSLHAESGAEDSFAVFLTCAGQLRSVPVEDQQQCEAQLPADRTWEEDSGTDESLDCGCECSHRSPFPSRRLHARDSHQTDTFRRRGERLPDGVGALATAAAVVEAAGSVIQLGEARKREGSRGWWRLTEVRKLPWCVQVVHLPELLGLGNR